MRKLLLRLFILCLLALRLYGVDFDTVIVGSSPFSLLEALYRSHLGESVLVVEKEDRLGGAWKTLDICGVSQVDLGCHQIGHSPLIQQFFEEYLGCDLVSLDNPACRYQKTGNQYGFYFSRGCRELLEKIQSQLSRSSVQIWLEHRVHHIFLDPNTKTAYLEIENQRISSQKIIVTPKTGLEWKGETSPPSSRKKTWRYHHLYLLIQDASPPRFCYRPFGICGTMRMINLTYFSSLNAYGQQLIAFQLLAPPTPNLENQLLEELKKQRLVDPGAFLLKAEPHFYEQEPFPQNTLSLMNPSQQEMIEILNTGHIQNLTLYIPKWKEILLKDKHS